jgi:hypothetical protein
MRLHRGLSTNVPYAFIKLEVRPGAIAESRGNSPESISNRSHTLRRTDQSNRVNRVSRRTRLADIPTVASTPDQGCFLASETGSVPIVLLIRNHVGPRVNPTGGTVKARSQQRKETEYLATRARLYSCVWPASDSVRVSRREALADELYLVCDSSVRTFKTNLVP